ncbi:MAG: hypothetical protein ACO2O2_16240 [Acidilobaceae archaeon]
MKARRGDLSGPVLAILVTLIILAIGAAIIAYFTLFAGQAPTPVLAVTSQPIAYKGGGTPPDAFVEVVVTNIGTAQVTLKEGETELIIVSPSGLVTELTYTTAILDERTTIAPGESKTLTFWFAGEWPNFANYRAAGAVLVLKDIDHNTVGQFEVSIRIVGGG